MRKKLRSFRVLSCTLAVLATIAFIIACGAGDIKDIVESDFGNAKDHADVILNSVLGNLPSSSEPEEQQVSSSSVSEESSPSISSSSIKEEPSSSSLPTPSSSSEDAPPPPDYPYKVECKLKVTTWTQNDSIPLKNWPEVKCIEKATSKSIGTFDLKEDVKWSGDPYWSTSYWKSPPGGTYSISIEIFDDASVKECRKLKADCEGKLTITAPSSSSYTPPPPPPPPPPTPSSSSHHSTTTSSSSKASSSSAAASGCTEANKNKYCHYGSRDKCYKMPTEDCCKDGTLVNSCDEAPATATYCNYGECKGGSGWNCTGGGGCYRMPTEDNCKNGTIVSTCPAGTKPPSADY